MSFITKLLVIFTVLISMVFPADVNGAVVSDVNVNNGVINYTVTNETGLVIEGDTWVESLEVKVLSGWVNCNASDEAVNVGIYLNPGDAYVDNYNAIVLLPGTYKLTVGYNVVTEFDGETKVGYSTVEFVVE